MDTFKSTLLPASVLAELYTMPLVRDENAGGESMAVIEPAGDGMLPQSEPVQKKIKPEQKTSGEQLYKFLGKNQKKVSVIATYPDDPYIPEEHLQFLVKVLSACKLNLGDVAILNDSVVPVAYAPLRKQLDPSCVLLFGITPESIGLPISFPQLKAQQYEGIQFLAIPKIADLVADQPSATAQKKQLWESLRKIFTV